MEKYILDKDIHVFGVTARSFPDGILEAHQKLHGMLPTTEVRNFFGISSPNKDGVIIYKAAVEELYPGEAENFECETFVIKKGEYISEILPDWNKEESIVGKTFEKLLSDPRIDTNGYCLEVYLNEKDMRCMVKLDPAKVSVSTN